MIISTTTIIAGAVVVLLAVLGSLINPFLRSLRFQKTETAENQPPVSILITAHDNLAELERNLPMFLRQQYAADYQVIVVCQSTDGETQDFLKRTAAENPHLYYTYIPEDRVGCNGQCCYQAEMWHEMVEEHEGSHGTGSFQTLA